MKRKGKVSNIQEIARMGRTFRGVTVPTGLGGLTKTVRMYVAVAMSGAGYDDKGIERKRKRQQCENKSATRESRG